CARETLSALSYHHVLDSW
nr:immunoglobulin heavy chain junction region [Macaca mulatta]MOX15529.1 immunoglobulin heavy chain junction region [Macaca mulatta]